MSLLNAEVKSQLQQVFEHMKDPVTLALFTRKGDCPTCEETTSYLNELAETTESIRVVSYDMEEDAALAQEYNVQMVPSIVLLDKENHHHGIKFNGIPAGHEVNSLVHGILEVSGAGLPLSEDVANRLSRLEKPVNIKVFVTLGCPHCPGAVEKAHKLALSSPWVDAEMVEAETFHELANQFNVSSVPKIVINDSIEFVGNQELEVFVDEIEKGQAVN